MVQKKGQPEEKRDQHWWDSEDRLKNLKDTINDTKIKKAFRAFKILSVERDYNMYSKNDYTMNEASFRRGFQEVFGYYNELLCSRLFFVIAKNCERFIKDRSLGINFTDFIYSLGYVLFDMPLETEDKKPAYENPNFEKNMPHHDQ